MVGATLAVALARVGALTLLAVALAQAFHVQRLD